MIWRDRLSDTLSRQNTLHTWKQLRESGAWQNVFVGGQSPGWAAAPQRGVSIARSPSVLYFSCRRILSRKPHKTFSTLLALLWVICEGIGSLPLQHFALSTSSRHLLAKDCIHQLPRWKANKSFLPLCYPTPNLGMKSNVLRELSVIFRIQ